jgi:Bacteriophage replication protein O
LIEARISRKALYNAKSDPLAPRPVGTGGYTQVPNHLLALALTELNPIDGRALLWFVRQTLGWKRAAVRVSVKDLATELGIRRSRVYEATAELKKRGLLSWQVDGCAHVYELRERAEREEEPKEPEPVRNGGLETPLPSAVAESPSAYADKSHFSPLLYLNTGFEYIPSDAEIRSGPKPRRRPMGVFQPRKAQEPAITLNRSKSSWESS